MDKENLVIFHGPCDDGFGAAYAAWKYLGDNAEYCQRGHADSLETLPSFIGKKIFLLDFSFKKEVMARMFQEAKQVIWLDHHKTSFQMFSDESVLPERIVSRVSEGELEVCSDDTGALLSCYVEKDHFTNHYTYIYGNHIIILDNNRSGSLITWDFFKELAPDREMEQPLLLRHIDDSDRWKFLIPYTKSFIRHLRSLPMDFQRWDVLSTNINNKSFYEKFIESGVAIDRFYHKQINDTIGRTSRSISIVCMTPDGEKIFNGGSVNANSVFANDIGEILALRSGTFGLSWEQLSNGSIRCSLRSVPEYDVSEIACCFPDGGGHKNSAGFTTTLDKIQSWLL